MRYQLLLAGFLFLANAFAAPVRYVTWLPWEVDSAVTAWVLKRYIAPEAQFIAVPKVRKLSGVVSIDTPDSPYRRSARYTAFDAALRIHGIDTPCTRALQPLIRILELAKWRKSAEPDAEAFEQALVPLMPSTAEGEMTIVFEHLDAFCAAHGGNR